MRTHPSALVLLARSSSMPAVTPMTLVTLTRTRDDLLATGNILITPSHPIRALHS